MNKQELIEQAYGPLYQLLKNHINENGWLDTKKHFGDAGNTLITVAMPHILWECYNHYDPKYCYFLDQLF